MKTGEHEIEAPTCWRCKRQVERFYVARDDITCSYVLTASCHGQTEHTRLTDKLLMDAISIKSSFAFKPKDLTVDNLTNYIERLP